MKDENLELLREKQCHRWRHFNEKKLYFYAQLLITILCIMALFGFGQRFLKEETEEEMIMDVLTSASYAWRRCIMAKMWSIRYNANAVWDNIGMISDKCEESSKLNGLRINGYENNEETKYHMLPLKSYLNSVIVTLGIGMDASAERKLKKQLTNGSHFYGADPAPENRKEFESIGSYFPFAVSGKSDVSKASVLANGTYKDQEVLHVDLSYFLTEMIDNQSKVYDSIWIDVEGDEFSLFPEFFKGGKLDKAGLHICQFNLEVHPPNSHQKQLFTDFINRIIDDQRYVFMKLSSIAGLWRLYFVNFGDLTCGQKYLVEK